MAVDLPGPPLFSVIVLNWNGKVHLEACLASLARQIFREFETIVVDNGSTDGSVPWLQTQRRREIRVIALPANQGFAGGNNAGIARARGDYVVLLNNDTETDPAWLLALSEAIGRHPEAGMFTPKILNFFRRDEIDNTGHVIYRDGLARGRHRLERDDGRFDAEGEVLSPSGCAGVYRKRMLDEIGLLDETFFAYGEDVDLGLRARWAGWTCIYVPSAVVYHKYSATAGAFSPQKAFLVERNRLWILFKDFPWWSILASPVATGYRYLMHLRGIVSRQGASARFARDYSTARLFAVALKAEVAALAGLPRVLRERRRLHRLRKIAPTEFYRLLDRFSMTARDAALKE